MASDDQFQDELKDVHERIHRKMERFEDRMKDRAEARLRRRSYRSSGSGIVIGTLIVAIGLLLLLDNMGIVRAHDFWRYWPVLLVVYGVSRLLSHQSAAGLVWGGVVALVGALLLLDNLDIIAFNTDLIWPLLLIAFGLSMLLRSIDRKRYAEGWAGGSTASSEPHLSIVAVFSGSRRSIDSPDFRGGEVIAIFGGVRLDLHRAAMTVDKAVIDINAVFGGVEIRVPETWSVQMKGAGIFGGFEDKTIHPKTDLNVKTPQLVITGASVFGGTSVTN